MAADQVSCPRCPTGQMDLVIGERAGPRAHCDRCGARFALDDAELLRQVAVDQAITRATAEASAADLAAITDSAAGYLGVRLPGGDSEEPDDPPEPVYDPGPEVDDQGGMSEYPYPEPAP